MIVPTDGLPAITEVGLTVNLVTDGEFTVKVAVSVFEYNVAVMTGETGFGTPAVVMLKVAEDEPAGTVTVAGTDAQVRLLAREMLNPPVGAGDPKVTVPVDDAVPITVAGVRERLSKFGAVKVSGAESETDDRVAVIFAEV